MAKVKAAPQTARLITINDTDDKSYDVVPGGDGSVDVEIPNRLAHSPFVQALAKEGHVVLSDVGEDESEDADIDELRAQAEALGIKVNKRWKAEKLQVAIEGRE